MFSEFLVLSCILSIHSVLHLYCLHFIFSLFLVYLFILRCSQQCKMLGLTELEYSCRVDEHCTFVMWNFSSSHHSLPLIPSQIFMQQWTQ